MKKIIFLLACLILAGIPSSFAQNPQGEDALILKARRFLAALGKNDFQAASGDFDETMAKVFGPEKMAAFWKQVPNQLSPFKRQTEARREVLGPYDVVLVTCEFEKTTLDARIVFDKDKKISGFQFVPSAPPAQYEPPGYADLNVFDETAVTVGSGEWALPGTLAVPKGAGPFPALVLVHGSGPNDRDETIGPNKPFRDIACGLASREIAVLRYEKRTRVYGTKIVADRKIGSSLTVKEESIDDALEAVKVLHKTARIDPKRIFILGHSLGGMLIPRIGVAGKNLGIAGFIIMAGLTLPLEDTMLKQYAYLYSLDGTLSPDDVKQLDDLKAQIARIKALKQADAGSAPSILNAPPSYWLDLRGYSPPDVAKEVPQPILVLQGGRDYQVTTENFDNWKIALGTRKNVEFRLYPNLNHLFIEGKGIPSPSEYTQKHGSVAEDVVTDIAAFIKKY